ncbi:hypothetical protein D3C81_366050 [compost metagenome]
MLTRHNAEGYVWTAEQRKNLREASLKREAAIRQKVSVNGIVYANLTQAGKAIGVSAKTIKRWATEGIPAQSSRNGDVPKELIASIRSIHFVQDDSDHGTAIRQTCH